MVEVAVSVSGKKRPWQGTVLAVLNIIGVVFAFIFGLLFLVLVGILGGMGGAMEPEVGGMFAGLMGGLAIGGGIFMIAIGVLLIFMARGALKGQKWSPIVSIVFGVLGILGALGAYDSSMLPTLAINAFILYLGVMCVRHPFYNKG